MVKSRRSEQSLFLFCCVACLCLLTDAIDCRRFVFAPLCRGISAKRSAKISNDELRELGDADESWMDWAKPSSDEKDSNLRKRRESNQLLKELLEKFQDYAALREEDK